MPVTSVNCKSILDCLSYFSEETPEKKAFVFLKSAIATEECISYAGLYLKVRRLSMGIAAIVGVGKPVFLIYQDAYEFLVTFLACQQAGLIPVPLPYLKGDRQLERLVPIQHDINAAAILCNAKVRDSIESSLFKFEEIEDLLLLATDELSISSLVGREIAVPHHEISFVQYTSGSTGNPKGVIVSTESLLHNQKLLQETFGCNAQSVIFSWLPFHHDMGLIGNILHTIYTGSTCILMPPMDFIQTPLKWLQYISMYKVTHSGGPNFAYDLCVDKIAASACKDIDLSSWKVAYNGAEPVSNDTMIRFSKHFKDSGFDYDAFYPCYGLAEATLLVSGRNAKKSPQEMIRVTRNTKNNRKALLDTIGENTRLLISSGTVAPEMDVRLFSPEGSSITDENLEGEVCIAGKSVTKGYWNKPEEHLFYHAEGIRFLRTGDLGFLIHNELFISGRLKEMIIIRGQNFYPGDIEQHVSKLNEAIGLNGVAAFLLPGTESRLVIAIEIKRTAIQELDKVALIKKADGIVNGIFGIDPYNILLISPLGIPRTTSGKLQRTKCAELYHQNLFKIIKAKIDQHEKPVSEAGIGLLIEEVKQLGDYESIKKYLLLVIRLKVNGLNISDLNENSDLTESGLDSLRAMELINTINKDLNIYIDTTLMFQANTLPGLIGLIENMLWLKNEQSSGKEIIL
ncbi:AMP-binding protein [Pedobacter alluvionis]|uniref:Acyl-CoA synthetase (AMP-forming)/AMP-acid ligase II n=1 Tax=Pedobacter alluvionis TaxID=475253 RepID=A0A497XWB9_9SPHI|nr:AMP-binding protein [Pedobacter alluvionis]RLJ72742.1 acyl-CoA synthetase (AMP-forming)/AMP-acid ligase II [Pedobacter alluvionis]TFB29413.1 hypothetical protein E3V97_20460 [Pedobacter alluvionis]